MLIDANGELMTNIVAPGTPAAGLTRVYVDSTTKILTFKNDAGLVGNAVVPSTAAAHQWANAISAAGLIGYSQPGIGDISGLGTGVGTALGIAVNGSGGIPSPTPVLAGDVIYWNGSTWVTLTGNNSGTQVWTENASGVPSWSTRVSNVTCGTGLSGGAITASGTCALALNSAIAQGAPGNLTGTASATPTMQGIGATCHITPVYSSRVNFSVLATGVNGTALNNAVVKLFFGTGTAPVNGAAVTGTAIGNTRTATVAANGGSQSTAVGGIATGLTPGTAYWFDPSLASSTGTATLTGIDCSAFEIL
jgi:hypothetical protein